MATFAEARARYPRAQFADVEYDAFVADPVGTVRGVYEAFDLGWRCRQFDSTKDQNPITLSDTAKQIK